MPREEWKRKRQKQPIQRPKQVPGPSKETPIEKTKRENLTLLDWMTVYAYVDTLPQPIHQGRVVRYFATRPEGALLFTQSTLSRKLRDRSEMEARADSIPNALSCKRPRVVTRPDVDRALWLWVQETEQEGEVVNSRMLIAQRKVLEEELNVPEDERLPGPGWVQSFWHAHRRKVIGKHGEGSVDIEIVEKEQALVAQLKERRGITGQPFTLDEPLDPKEEREIGDSSDLEIVAMVQAEMGLARGDIDEIDSDSDDDDPEVVPPSLKEMIEACRMLEENSLLVCTEDVLDFVEAIRRFRGRLQKMSREGAKQTTIDMFFNPK